MSDVVNPSTPIFLPLIGQYNNIGDIILRRPLAKWLQGHGKLHVFVGQAPSGFVKGLGLTSDDVYYESFKSWYLSGLSACTQQKAVYLSKPGEIQLTALGMKEHIGVLPLMLWLKLRGGRVARLGAGTRNFSQLYRTIMMPAVALSGLTYWRDRGTHEFIHHGGLMPDFGYYEGSPVETIRSDAKRNIMVVSMRGDKPAPNKVWLESVRQFAKTHGLELWVVTQVHSDAELSAQLAQQLDARLLNWDGRDHHLQEEKLRALYQQTLLTVSDRLHVLIAAFTEGAMPAGLLTAASNKIGRHFNVLEMNDVEHFEPDWTVQEICKYFDKTLQYRDHSLDALEQARETLDQIKAQLLQYIDSI